MDAEIYAIQKFSKQSDYRSANHYRDYFAPRSKAREAKTIFEVLQCAYTKNENENNCEKDVVHAKNF